MNQIDPRFLFRGINARRSNVSVVSPSSDVPSPVETIISGETVMTAFQDDAFQEDAFQ